MHAERKQLPSGQPARGAAARSVSLESNQSGRKRPAAAGASARFRAENMSKRSDKNKNRKPDVSKEANYYKLKTKAVQDLVEADESNSPEVSEEELNKYRSGPKIKVADWVKILLLKWWFAGAVCFFFIWGLSGYMSNMLDTLFVPGFAMGVVTDLLTNNALRFFEPTPGANDRYIMVTKRGYVSFFLNILYAFIVLFFVYCIYAVINYTLTRISGNTDTIPLGVEPILFGLFYLAVDQLLIKCKLTIVDIFRKARNVNGSRSES